MSEAEATATPRSQVSVDRWEFAGSSEPLSIIPAVRNGEVWWFWGIITDERHGGLFSRSFYLQMK
jgi:hypothetical protein